MSALGPVALGHPLGAVLDDVDLGALDAAGAEELRDLLAERGVVVARRQHLDDAGQVAFLRLLGELAFTQGETPVPGCPELNLVTNVGRDRPPVSRFHVDTSYVADPPAYTALRAVLVPAAGGDTLFSDQYRALAQLPPELAAAVRGRTVTHVVTGLDPATVGEARAEHPLVRPHPRTGRPVLYLTVPSRCAAVSGLDREEGARLVAELHRRSTAPDNTWRHRWRPGDVVVWDNACVMHRADHDGARGDRTLHRGMVAASGHGRAAP